MGNFSLAVTMLFILAGFYVSTFVMLAITAVWVLSVAGYLAVSVVGYVREVNSTDHRPPVAGPIISQLIHFHKLYDHLTTFAMKNTTFRFIDGSRSHVYTVDPVNVEYVLKTNFDNYGRGGHQSGILHDLLGDGIFAVDGDKWRHQRKLASFEFSAKVLRDFSTADFISKAAKLAVKISIAAATEQMVNLQDLLMKASMDSMFKVGFGSELDTLSGSDEVSNLFLKAFDDSNVLVCRRFSDPLWKVKRFYNISSEAVLKGNIMVIDNFVYALIRSKREQMIVGKDDRGKEDILSRFLMQSLNDPENVTDKYLRDITLSFLFAGKDTTANMLTWFFYVLCKHPVIQEKLAQEVRDATLTEGVKVSVDEFANKLTQVAIDRMQYLHAALTETLRLYPPVPVDGKCAEKDDVLPDGFRIKTGDPVYYIAYAMGRMRDIWGDDAEEFRPERWFNNGVFQAESPFKFTAFQAGPRICLGKEFAYRQMKVFAATLLFFFKFKLVDVNKEATYRTMFTLHMDQGLHLYPIPRL